MTDGKLACSGCIFQIHPAILSGKQGAATPLSPIFGVCDKQ
jgi:hypothetical protein